MTMTNLPETKKTNSVADLNIYVKIAYLNFTNE